MNKEQALTKEANKIVVGDMKLDFDSESRKLFDEQMALTTKGVKLRLPQIKIIKETAQFMFPDESTVNEFKGVILDHSLVRSYWENEFNANNIEPPTCSSLDCIKPTSWSGQSPIANLCNKCPLSKWTKDESGKLNAKGKVIENPPLCKQARRVHILVDGYGLIPHRMSLSPTSIGDYDNFITSLISKGIPMSLAIVSFKLRKDVKGGYDVSIINPEFSSFAFSDNESAQLKVREMADKQSAFAEDMSKEGVEADEYAAEYSEQKDAGLPEDPFNQPPVNLDKAKEVKVNNEVSPAPLFDEKGDLNDNTDDDLPY